MKRFKTYLSEGRQDYFNMFEKVLDLINEVEDLYSPSDNILKKQIKINIREARLHLKRNDRIIWFLKYYRLEIMDIIQNSIDRNVNKVSNLVLLKNKEKWRLLAKEYLKKTPYGSTMDFLEGQQGASMRALIYDIQHYLDLDIPTIEEYKFENKTIAHVMDDLGELENMWRSRPKKETVSSKKIFLKISDRWSWHDLESNTDSEEADSMGHCSTGPEGTTCLSLREKTSKGWKPHLTFIYDPRTKKLGEMKGKQNKKPSPKYHKYILELLYDKRIQGFASQSQHHVPQNNFSIDDLDNSDYEKLARKRNINLFITIDTMFKRFEKYPNEKMSKLILDRLKIPRRGDYHFISPNKFQGTNVKTFGDLFEHYAVRQDISKHIRYILDSVYLKQRDRKYIIESMQKCIDSANYQAWSGSRTSGNLIIEPRFKGDFEENIKIKMDIIEVVNLLKQFYRTNMLKEEDIKQHWKQDKIYGSINMHYYQTILKKYKP